MTRVSGYYTCEYRSARFALSTHLTILPLLDYVWFLLEVPSSVLFAIENSATMRAMVNYFHVV